MLNIKKRIKNLTLTNNNDLKSFVFDIVTRKEIFDQIQTPSKHTFYDPKIVSNKVVDCIKTIVTENSDENYSIKECIKYNVNGHKKVVKKTLLFGKDNTLEFAVEKQNEIKWYAVNKDNSVSPLSIVPKGATKKENVFDNFVKSFFRKNDNKEK